MARDRPCPHAPTAVPGPCTMIVIFLVSNVPTGAYWARKTRGMTGQGELPWQTPNFRNSR